MTAVCLVIHSATAQPRPAGQGRKACAPAKRSPAADRKASRKTTGTGQPACGFRDLLDHLATLTRQTITIGDHQIGKITAPTPTQRQAFDLPGAPVPITLE